MTCFRKKIKLAKRKGPLKNNSKQESKQNQTLRK